MTGGKKNLSLCYLNVRSLRNKCNEVDIFLRDHPASIFCVAEHWLAMDELEVCSLREYRLVSNFCRSGQRGGGTAIYGHVNFEINASQFDVECIEKDIEFCCASFMSLGESFLVICIYRSPDGNIDVFAETLSDVLNIACVNFEYVFLCGDFNVNFHEDTYKSNLVKDTCSLFGLEYLVKQNTRSNNCIDNIFTNFSRDRVNTVIIDCYFSDHNAIGVDVGLTLVKPPQYIEKRLYCNESMVGFLESLASENWMEVDGGSDTDTKYGAFYSVFSYYFEKHFPLQKVRIVSQGKLKWVDGHVEHLKNSITDLHYLCKVTNDEDMFRVCCERKRELKILIENRKKSYFSNRIINSSNKSREVWKIINSEINNKSKNKAEGIVLNQDGAEIRNPHIISEIFLNHFTLPCAESPNANEVSNHIARNLCSLYLRPTCAEEILEIMDEIASKSSFGLDGVPMDLVKKSGVFIAKPLEGIANSMLLEGVFPHALKHAKIVPVHKKSQRSDVNNYRPISILSSFSKVFEKIIYRRLYDFFLSNELFGSSQFGFLRGGSCEKAIFNCLHKILSSLDGKKKVCGIYFDLCKAFETIDHRILYNKLEKYGVRGNSLNLIKSYLSDRTHCVCISTVMNGTSTYVFSPPARALQGVPQGSILGPLLFVIYANDLSSFVGIDSVYQYADDTTCIVYGDTFPEVSEAGARVVGAMSSWGEMNGLKLNIMKTGLINFNSNQNQIELNMGSDRICQTSSVKFLGLALDDGLKWEYQIDALSKELSRCYYAIYKLRNFVGISSLKTYYFSHVQSRLSYGLIFWGSSPCFQRIFIMQKKIIRCMLHKPSMSPCKPLFQSLGMLSLPCLYIYRLLSFYINNTYLYVKNENISSSMTTRRSGDLAIPRHSSALFERGAFYKSILAFNALPQEIKSINNKNKFVKSVYSFLLAATFYSFAEYVDREGMS